MKTKSAWILLACFVGITTLGVAQPKASSSPGYLPIDETLNTAAIQPKVNLHLPKFLIKEMITDFENGSDNPLTELDINLSELVSGVDSLRIVVIEPDGETRKTVQAATQRLTEILNSSWMPVINVPEENVGIYTVSNEAGDQMAGLALLVNQEDTVVILNIVGRIPLGKIIKLAINNNALPENLLEQLSAAIPSGEVQADTEDQPGSPK